VAGLGKGWPDSDPAAEGLKEVDVKGVVIVPVGVLGVEVLMPDPGVDGVVRRDFSGRDRHIDANWDELNELSVILWTGVERGRNSRLRK
jgi:hypothetical protein